MKVSEFRGFGDVVAEALKLTGVESVVKAVVGDDCGCASRQAKLNDMFPFGSPKDQYYIDKLNGNKEQS